MEIIETTETLRLINAAFTPISLFLSFAMLIYSLRAWNSARSNKSKNEVVGIALLGVSSIFVLEAVILTLVYSIIFTTDDRALINFVVNTGFLITIILIIATSALILGIYRNRI